jgi:hypothetical protein
MFAKRVGTVDATWTAMLVISALLFLNITSIFLLLFKQNVFLINPRLLGGLVIVLVGLANYLIFIRKDFCFEVIKQFESESIKKKNLSVILTLLYVIFTILLSHVLI